MAKTPRNSAAEPNWSTLEQQLAASKVIPGPVVDLLGTQHLESGWAGVMCINLVKSVASAARKPRSCLAFPRKWLRMAPLVTSLEAQRLALYEVR